MVKTIDFNKPVYSAVNINIKKPEVDARVNGENDTNPMTVNNDNGIYNAVKINIDNPKVNTQPKKVYDYPEANGIVTYEMLSLNPVAHPAEDADAMEIKVPNPNYTTVEDEKKILM
jgi:hypothetical protein